MAIVERGRSAFLESTKPSTDEGFLVSNTLTLLTGIKLWICKHAVKIVIVKVSK
jgi:hypothetical protein